MEEKKFNKKAIFVAFSIVFSLTIIGLWIVSVAESSFVVAVMGAGYAFLCTAFLTAQMVAFVKAHMDYDKTIEQPKFELLQIEEDQWGKAV